MYKVIKLFTDLQDNNYKYEVGDEYPRLGLTPDLSRIAELSGANNKQHAPLIKEVDNLEEPKKKSTRSRKKKVE